MPELSTKTEQPQSPSREEQIAQRWLRRHLQSSPRMIQGTEPPDSSPGSPQDLLTQEAYSLFVEKRDLRYDITAKQRTVAEPSPTFHVLPHEAKRELIRQGKISAYLSASHSDLPYHELIANSQTRIAEIDNRIARIFSTPAFRDEFVRDLSRQVRLRHRAREARSLDQFVNNVELISLRLTRQAQVQGRALTSVERRAVAENRALAEEARARRAELLQDPAVFDRVRLLELRGFRDQLRRDRFAETPSRRMYLEKIERYWAEGKKVLLTGETGTGKTEMIKHASNMLFGANPETVTGHQDLSIYELLGKTGFQVQVGDIFRPAPLIRAMTGRDGKGQPFLFDEIDRAPNQAVMGIKTILNARPGEKGVKVQTDTAGSFDVGPDYAVSATANIKSEKYITATELDPAIVRIFDAPLDIDYMPAYEVYDLALASLMDRNGGLPLTERDARFTLRNLCDAASWIQDAYQGRKIITDPASDAFLKARGQATTGKTATLKKALLDPGRALEMLRGWTVAQTSGVSFGDYINERVLEFVNNRAYPEEDRYYLAEIFALKGFLRGCQVSRLMVSGLDQATFDRWAGSPVKKTAGPTPAIASTGAISASGALAAEAPAYLPWARVARLDPYRRFKRPVSRDAEELLAAKEVATTDALIRGGSIIDRARAMLGRDFLGVEALRKLESELRNVGVEVAFAIDRLPPFPFTEEDLRAARSLGEMLVLRPQTMLIGNRETPLTLIDFRELFREDPLGELPNVLYSFRPGANDWYKEEEFATQPGEIKLEWSLVKKDVLDGSTNASWNKQKDLLQQYEGILRRKGAYNISVRRRTATETLYDLVLYYVNTGERLLADVFDWGQTRPNGGHPVCVGGFDVYGLRVYSRMPERAYSDLGACPSR